MVSKTNVPRCSRNSTVSIVPSNNKTQDREPKTEPFFLLLFPRRITKTKLKITSNLFRLLTTLEISMKSSFLIDILGTGQPLLLAVMGSHRWRMMVNVELLDVIWDSDIQKENSSLRARVRGRNADLSLVKKVLGWKPRTSLEKGLETTYKWINKMLHKEQ